MLNIFSKTNLIFEPQLQDRTKNPKKKKNYNE